MVSIEDIKTFFRGRIALGEPLKKYTSFRIGGPADYYLEPADRDDLIRILNYLQEQQFPLMVIGKGSNMLVSDDGVRGAVINLGGSLTSMHAEGRRVFVEAGVTLTRFVDFCVRRGLKGVEMLAGIPGTVGGAVIMNAGAYGGETADTLVDVEVLRQGTILFLKKSEIAFSYRRSSFRGEIILSASFDLTPAPAEEIARVRKELLLKRNRTQPVNMLNSGSMFKNPPGNFAAKLIDEAGLKGTRIGDAQISELHANFFVNHGSATAGNVLDLIRLAQQTVLDKFGIALELEVKLVGFPQPAAEERIA